MTFQGRGDYLLECRVQQRPGADLVTLDQCGITDNVCGKYRCKPTFGSFRSH